MVHAVSSMPTAGTAVVGIARVHVIDPPHLPRLQSEVRISATPAVAICIFFISFCIYFLKFFMYYYLINLNVAYVNINKHTLFIDLVKVFP